MENHHYGRGGQGNVMHVHEHEHGHHEKGVEREESPHPEGLADKLKHKILGQHVHQENK